MAKCKHCGHTKQKLWESYVKRQQECDACTKIGEEDHCESCEFDLKNWKKEQGLTDLTDNW